MGRLVHGIPAGLLIYAARVHHSHWDEAGLRNQVVVNVLNALRDHYRTDVSYDLAYAWQWPAPRPIAHQIVRHELEWFEYHEYLADLEAAFASGARNIRCSAISPSDTHRRSSGALSPTSSRSPQRSDSLAAR